VVSRVESLFLRAGVTLALVVVGLVLMNLPALLSRKHGTGLSMSARWSYVDSAPAVPGAPGPDSLALVQALARVPDPEIDLSIVDLGLLDSLAVDSSGNVRVVLVLTSPECPFHVRIARHSLEELKSVPGVRRINLRLDPRSEWDPSRLTEEGKRKFREVFGDPSDSAR